MKLSTSAIILFLALSLSSVYGAERLRIGVSNYNLSSLSMGVAHSRGFFKEEGFDSEVIRMNPNVATTAAVTGDIDFSALIGSLIGAAIKGAPLKLVACSQDRTPIVFVARPEFKSMKELRGKIIGIPSYGSTPDVVGRMVLRHFGVDPEKEIKAVALGTDAARLAALKEGIVDAIIVAPPIDYEGKKLGFNVLARAGDIFTFPYNGLGTNVKKIKERPDQVKRAIRALIKANNYIRKNREGTIRVLMEWTKTRQELAEASYASSWEYFSPDANIPEDGLRVVIDGFRKSLGITRPIAISEIVDDSALREARRELGITR
ncbi:MAG: ABC transporter substrate-binding protein [Deltaproteobacteria bacterium]|nr:ABC transporter substrate-binding protein [Deltaproteobacteria bacterium]